MGCRYEWADDSHLIMDFYIEAPWTWEEYSDLANEAFSIIRDMGKPCATVVEVSKMGALPKGNALMHLSRIEKLMPENVFASVVVGAPFGAMVFMDVLMRARPRAKRLALFTKTLPEAHEKVKAKYQQLYPTVGKTQTNEE